MRHLLPILAFCYLLPISLSAQITIFPYSHNFDSWTTCNASCGSACALQDNWTNTGTKDYTVDADGTSSSSTGPNTDHTTGTSSGNYLYTETSSPCFGTNDTWVLQSPSIDLTGSNDMQFTFWYHMYGTAMGNAHVDISSDGGTTWTDNIVAAWTDNQDIWQEKIISLGAWVDSTVIVRIRYEGATSFTADFAIDDIHIYDLLEDDASISDFINPTLPTCSYNDSVAVLLTNYGTDTLYNVTIDWEWNGVIQNQFLWSGALVRGEVDTVFLGNVSYVNGDSLKAWTSQPNGITEFLSGAGNDTTSILLSTGFSGVYTVGGVSPDYTTLDSAIQDLNTFGVCSSVVLNLRPGTYNEQVVLSNIEGVDSVNTITIRSENGDRSAILSFESLASNNNFTLKFDEGSYFSIEQLTIEATGTSYAHVIEFTDSSNWNRIWDCHLRNADSTFSSTSSNYAIIYSNNVSCNHNHFLNNLIESGSHGVYYRGISSTSLSEGTIFDQNEFLNNYYYGIHLYYQNAPVFTNNTIHGASAYTSSRYATQFVNCDNETKITNNAIYGDTIGWRYGIYLTSCEGTAMNSALVANNMIQVGNIDTASTVNNYGIYLSSNAFTNVYANNVLMSSGGASSHAFYSSGGGANKVKNNNFVNLTAGYASYIPNVYSIIEMDNNNLFSPLGKLGYYNNNDQLTFSEWQVASNFDLNGVSVDPLYHSNHNLHVCNDTLQDLGVQLTSVTTDFDGQPRSVTPDIGADEFTGLSKDFLGQNFDFCLGDTVSLMAGSIMDTILWSTGDTTVSIDLFSAGTYTATISNTCGTGSDDVTVNELTVPTANFTWNNSFITGLFTNYSTGDGPFTYSWDFGDGNTTTEENPVHPYTSVGPFWVELTVTNECGSNTFGDTVLLSTVGIEEYTLAGEMLVYPNPSKDLFTVDLNLSVETDITIQVENILGAVVYSSKPGLIQGAYNETIKLENTTSGLYFVRVTSDQGQMVKRIIIQ